MLVTYESDSLAGIVERMDAAIRLASRRFAQGASAAESLATTNAAIALAIELPPELFVRMSPQSMISLLEVSSADPECALVTKVAEALALQAEVLQSEGELLEAKARRDQADQLLAFIDPGHAN